MLDHFHVMRRRFINWSVPLLLLLLALRIGGVVTGVVIPLFVGVRAERVGATAFGVAAAAEGVLVVFEWFAECARRSEPEQDAGFPGPKRYGNKMRVA